MSWIALLSTLLAIVKALVSWMESKQLLEAGAAQAVLKGVRDADDAIDRAQKARVAVPITPDKLRDNDGYRRD